MILRVAGDALLLRVAWIERHDFRTKRTEYPVFVQKLVLTNFLILKMSKSVQKSSILDAFQQLPYGGDEDESANSSKDSNP